MFRPASGAVFRLAIAPGGCLNSFQMNIIGAVSGGVLGYINGNVKGAIKGAKLGYKLSQSNSDMPPIPRKQYARSSALRRKNETFYRSKNPRSSGYKRRNYSNGPSLHTMILKEMPAKHYENSIIQSSLLHNGIYSCTPSTGVVQGSANTQRIGDSIQMVAIKIRGFVQSNSASNAYQYRMIVGWSGEEFSLATSFSAGLGSTEVFLPNSVSNWIPNGIINPKAFTVLADSTIVLNSQIASVSDLEAFNFTVPINQKFDYQAASSVYGKTKNLYILVIPAVVGGVTASTGCGQIVLAYDLIFK